jgi:outer membrane protein assembly factor BamB
LGEGDPGDIERALLAGLAMTTAGCLSDPSAEEPAQNETGATRSEQSGEDNEPALAGTWPQFGADTRNTGTVTSVSGPGTTDAELAWRYDAGTPTMNSSPIVGDGTVYAPGSGDPGLIHAIDIETGEQLWEFEPAGYATSALALADETLFAGTWGKEFYAIDAASGDLVWREAIGHRFGTSSPVVVDGTVYVGTIGDGPLAVTGPEDEDEFEACVFLALDAETGAVQWTYGREQDRWEDEGEEEDQGDERGDESSDADA